METGDTNWAITAWRPAVGAVAAAAALAAAPACRSAPSPATAAAVAADPCDPTKEFERCGAGGARLRCDERAQQWWSIGFCPSGTACVEVRLPPAASPTGANDARCDGGVFLPSDASGSAISASSGSPRGPGPGGSDAGADTYAADAGAVDSGAACGDGVCGAGEKASSCPADCATTCGDGGCATTEKSTCAWDCVAGAAAGAQCMVAACPAAAIQCKAAPACALKLATVWACAKGCVGCLAACMKAVAGDPVAYSVAACGAAACVGSAPP